eukprot:Nitzschia sp. Nitz4//scaffold255_size41878//10719//11966//NITZ4_007400-RA/size41878-processed-gene-0.10-mRNA-1//1//CDS//3329544356//6698//frame0
MSNNNNSQTTTTELRLVPAPGQKPEFLAQLQPVSSPNPLPQSWIQFHSKSNPSPVIVLQGYTRDDWASDTSTTTWESIRLQSIDGRQKLPGFVKYLRERQKSAFGLVGSTHVLVIPHKQMSSSVLNGRLAPLEKLPTCPLAKKVPKQQAPPVAATPKPTAPVPTQPQPAAAPKRKGGGFGLLGNLVGAQRRTNHQVQTAAKATDVAAAAAPAAANSTSDDNGVGNNNNEETPAPEDLITAGQLLADFRQEMEQEMLDFDIASEGVLKVQIDLPAKLRRLLPEEKQSGRVTMEVLKYIVYEQAEEVNEEWIAYKEPSEFMDEVTISIYKEGEAPPEVLEDINKAELPDEIRGQQRAMQEQRQKAEQNKAQRMQMETTRAALQSNHAVPDDDFAALNTQKRDRRTIEDYEREAKRRK